MDQVLQEHEEQNTEQVTALRWHLDRARKRITELRLAERPGIIIHGDFAPWNLLYQDGVLSGVIDFEHAHLDHRVGDFALSWRGKYDDLVLGYHEVSPLEDYEWELLTPLWWSGLIANACQDLAARTPDDGWTMRKLLLRSPLMGPDSVEYKP